MPCTRWATSGPRWFSACGESIETLRDHLVTIDFDGVAVRTLDLAGLLETKQTARDKDRVDRAVQEQALAVMRRSGRGDR